MDLILKYFPDLTKLQIDQFDRLLALYKDWNAKINVISRNDIDELYLRHVLHSLGIAKVIQFKKSTKILDVGTGGGFPGIPLAILYPDSYFHLVDSINKKLIVINAVTEALELRNVITKHSRVEVIEERFDFIVSRAVTAMPAFVNWVKDKTLRKNRHDLINGIIYLKGGDLNEELQDFPKASIFHLKEYFEEDFFKTKKIVYLPLKYKI